MNLDQPTPPNPYDHLPTVTTFPITSADVRDGEQMDEVHVFDRWGMTGGNASPQLAWHGFPAGTKSFAVTLFDPDAPTGSGFWHWLLIDVPATVTTLARGAGAREGGGIPARSFHVRNDYGEQAYGGPPPPQGDRPHRYIFAVHALDVEKLGIDASASPAIAGFNLTFRTLARGLLVPVYGF
jgi:Raf kinase inhibitor-like YbhB/YbcL family protein